MKKIMSMILVLALVLTSINFVKAPKTVEASEGAGDYYIQVNKGTNVVTVFKKKNNKPYKAMICSTGHDTPVGTFYTPWKKEWHELLGPSWGQYNTRITGGFLFHSVWYYTNHDKSSISVSAYNYLGNTASHGCVRLLVKDAKWIYDKCPLGTKVVIINGNSSNDPLGKPSFMKINPGSYKGWDPTDPDPHNPYLKSKPKIKLKERNVQYGTKKLDLTSLVEVKNAAGVVVTEGIKTKGKVNTSKLGKYKVRFTYKDDIGNVVRKRYTIKVVNEKKPIIEGAKNHNSIEMGATLNIFDGISAKSFVGTDISDKLTVTVRAQKKGAKKFTFNYGKGQVKFAKPGDYKLIYKVTDSNGKTRRISKIYKVIDMHVKLSVEMPTEVEFGTQLNNLKSYAEVSSYKGKMLSKRNLTVTGNVDTTKLGTYTLTFTATQKKLESRKVTKTVTVKVVNKEKPEFRGVSDLRAFEGDKVNLLNGVKAFTKSGFDISKFITVAVDEQKVEGGIYTATAGVHTIQYDIAIPGGLIVTVSAKITVDVKQVEDPTDPVNPENPNGKPNK